MVLGVSAIPSYMTWSNVRRFGKMIPYYLCDGSVVHQEALQQGIKGMGYKNFGKVFKQSLLTTENAYKNVLNNNGGSFFKYAGKTLRELPGEVGTAWSDAGAAAKAVGKSGLWGSVKGAGSAIGKRIPLIGSLIYAATEVPNIARATADCGIVTGAGEAVKAGSRMLGFAAGAAIGQALIPIPFVGGIIGGMVGEKLTSMLTGKSYSEQKEEIEKKATAQVTTQTQGQEGVVQTEGESTAPAEEEEEYIVENPFGGTLTNKQLAELEELQKQIIQNDSTFNVSA